MKTKLLIISIIFVLQSCSAWKKELASNGNYEVAISNAVIDFCNTSYLANRNKAFSVSYQEYNTGLIGISVLEDINKIYSLNDSLLGRVKDRFIHHNDNLFYWYDKKKGRDSNIVNKLYEFNIIEKVDSITEDMGYTIDDRQKATQYYFCKNNLLIYKKEKTSIAMPSKKVNNLNCE